MVKPTHVFLSDVHLGAFSSDIEKKNEESLIALIEYCIEHKTGIYILGDLFDYWMEFPHKNYVPDLSVNVFNAFKKYNKSVQKALYITGNHDNWTFGYFDSLGFDVEQNYRIIKIEKNKILLMHGDGTFDKRDDFIRPFFHSLLRHPLFIRIFQAVFPPQFGLSVMKWFSSITRNGNHRNPKPLNNHASYVLKTNDINWVIMGHDHLPRLETFEHGSYINLGTFFKDRTVAIYNNNELELVRWMASSKEFVPFKESKLTE